MLYRICFLVQFKSVCERLFAEEYGVSRFIGCIRGTVREGGKTTDGTAFHV